MTTINTISPMNGPAPAAGAQGPANAAGPQGLIDFLNLILGPAAGAQSLPGAAAGAQDLSAKVTELLKNNPGLQNNSIVQALLKLLGNQQGALPATAQADDLLKKIAELLQNPAPQQAADIKPSLTSDLTAEAAPVLQAVPPAALDGIRAKIETLMASEKPAAADAAQVAQALNALEPQASAQDTPVPQAPVLAPAAEIRIDPRIMQQMEDRLDMLADGADADGKAALAQFKEDMIVFLKDKGLSIPAIHTYMAALVQAVETKETPVDAAANNAAPTLPQTAPAAALAAPQTQGQTASAQDDAAGQVRMDAPKPQAGENAKPQAPRQQADAPQPQAAPAPKSAALPAHAALVNALASGDADFGANGGWQDQSSSGTMNGQGFLKAADGTNAQSFVNYMQAARGAQSPVTQMVSVQLQTNAMQRVDMMTLQLEPADLGRLDIKMKFEKDGTVRAHLTADKPETLALLQRDSTHLQKALQQAGFDTDDGAISFDLRQQGQDLGHARDDARQGGAYRDTADRANENTILQANIAVQGYGTISQNSINIMV